MISSLYNITSAHAIQAVETLPPTKQKSCSTVIFRLFIVCIDTMLSKLSSVYVRQKTIKANQLMHARAKQQDIANVFNMIFPGNIADLNAVNLHIEEVAQKYLIALARRKDPSFLASMGEHVTVGFANLSTYVVQQLYTKIYRSSRVDDKAKVKSGYLLVEGSRLMIGGLSAAKAEWNKGNKKFAAQCAALGVGYGVMGAMGTALSWMKSR